MGFSEMLSKDSTKALRLILSLFYESKLIDIRCCS